MIQEKINIAELLKDCPKGMELDCAMFEDVFFDEITNNKIFPICIKRIDGHPVILTKYGGYANCPSSKCVIFPKGKTTWEGFVPPLKLKNGDVIYVKDAYGQEWCSIIDNCKHGALYTYVDICIESNKLYRGEARVLCYCKDVKEYRRATEKEKQILFDAIKANGYKWNEKSKSLEKLVEPKFKVGDKIKQIGSDRHYIIKNIEFDRYILHNNRFIRFTDEHIYELVPNKFDITTLNPFDKVLARDSDKDMWCASIFSHTWKDKYFCVGAWHNQCIPYEANKELLGTNNDCDEFYKTWE